MKIIIAMDSFKGSMSSLQAVNSVEKGIKKAVKGWEREITVEKILIADGGEGTVDAVINTVGGRKINTQVLDPLGRTIDSFFGLLPDRTAIIEMAAASGLNLIEESEKNPFITTTYGTGQLIKKAISMGCEKIILGIGGSATNDGGIGMAQALGARFLDDEGNELGFGGESISKLRKIDISNLEPRIKKVDIVIASDVTNTLCGDEGAAAIYGPQKGATQEMIKILDANLKHLAEIIEKDLNKDILNTQGGGAAGGLGAGLMAFLNANMQSGIDTVMELINFKEKVSNANIVVTGEGAIDYQTAFGKVPYGIAKAVDKKKTKVICICGTLGEGYEKLYDMGIDALFSIANKPMPLKEAMENGEQLLEEAAENLFRLIFGFME